MNSGKKARPTRPSNFERKIMLDVMAKKQGKLSHEQFVLNLKENMDGLVKETADRYFRIGQTQLNIFDTGRSLTTKQKRLIKSAVKYLHAIDYRIDRGLKLKTTSGLQRFWETSDFDDYISAEHVAQELELQFPNLFK